MKRIFLFIAVFYLSGAKAADGFPDNCLQNSEGTENNVMFFVYSGYDAIAANDSTQVKSKPNQTNNTNKKELTKNDKNDSVSAENQTKNQKTLLLGEDGTVIARKFSKNIYKIENGITSIKVENNQFWMLNKEVPDLKPLGYYEYSNDEYTYYDHDGNIVARYIPSQGRYYLTTAKGKDILKEVSYAVLYNGDLLIGVEPPMHYYLEGGFDPVVAGYFLFSSYIH